MLDSNTLIASVNVCLCTIFSVLTPNCRLRWVGLIEIWAWSWRCEYSFWLSAWTLDWGDVIRFRAYRWRNRSAFGYQLQWISTVPSISVYEAIGQKQTNSVQHLLVSTGMKPNFLVSGSCLRQEDVLKKLSGTIGLMSTIMLYLHMSCSE